MYWENECLRLQLTSLVLLEKLSKMDNVSLHQKSQRTLPINYQYRGSFPSDYLSTVDNDTFAIINTQPSNMQGEHWIMIAIFRQELYFADFLGCEGYSFLNNNN